MSNLLRSSIPYKGPISENLIEFMKHGLRKNAKETILIDSTSDRTWTGEEIEKTVSRLARYLIDECQLKKGDVCSLYGPTNDSIALLILAIGAAGGVSVYLTDRYRAREVLDTAKTTNCKYLVSYKDLLQEIQPTLKEIDSKIQVISFDEPCDGYKNGCKQIGSVLTKNSSSLGYTFEELIQKVDINVEKDFAVIQFSSGTTGKPKPIPRTHKNLCHLVASVDHEELMNLKPGQVMTGALPMTHRPGLWALLACVNGGSTLVIWSKQSDVEGSLSTIEKYKVTIFSSSLPLLSMLGNSGINMKDRFDLSSLKHIITSGAKIVHPDLPTQIVDNFKLESLRQCFGMTESGWVFLIESSQAKDNYLTVGHVCPGMEAIVIDQDTGKPLGVGLRGELALKGPQIFPGYLTDQQGVFNRSDFTEDGFFKTGDQCYYDSKHHIFIEGRYKELMLLSTTGRFFPNEIETVISEHPAIGGVCVVKAGESEGKSYKYDLARAFVTLKQGYQVTEKELTDFLIQRAYEAVLDGGVRFLDKFPRLENGKVDKQALKNME